MGKRQTLTRREVAGALGLSLNAIDAAIQRKEIPATRVGRRVLIPRAALERLLRGEAGQEAE